MKKDNIFKNISWNDWLKINDKVLQKNDISRHNKFKNKLVPPGIIIKEIGLSGYSIGNWSVCQENCNSFCGQKGASTEAYYMLVSFIKMRIRDKLGIQLQENFPNKPKP